MVRTDPGLRMPAFGKVVLPPLLTLAAWLGMLSWWTSGFTAFTTYSYTLDAAGDLPRPTPLIHFRDQFGVVHDTAEYEGSYVLLQFAYLSCGDVCPLTIADSRRIHEALSNRMPSELRMLTVSIDPLRDTEERLFATWLQHGRPAGWTLAALASPLDEDMQAKLRQLGFWVSVRDANFFNHSAQLFLIDPKGRVVQVFEGPDISRQVIAALQDTLS